MDLAVDNREPIDKSAIPNVIDPSASSDRINLIASLEPVSLFCHLWCTILFTHKFLISIRVFQTLANMFSMRIFLRHLLFLFYQFNFNLFPFRYSFLHSPQSISSIVPTIRLKNQNPTTWMTFYVMCVCVCAKLLSLLFPTLGNFLDEWEPCHCLKCYRQSLCTFNCCFYLKMRWKWEKKHIARSVNSSQREQQSWCAVCSVQSHHIAVLFYQCSSHFNHKGCKLQNISLMVWSVKSPIKHHLFEFCPKRMWILVVASYMYISQTPFQIMTLHSIFFLIITKWKWSTNYKWSQHRLSYVMFFYL